MASDRQRLEEGSTDDYGSEPNTTPIDELTAVSALARGAGELMIIKTLQRFIRPVLVPILKPLIRQIVEEQIGLAKQELLASMKESPQNEASTPVPKRLKLQFRNRISMPVFTGKRLVGENDSTIEIALVDAFTEQIMNTGMESTAKLEIVGFRVGDDGSVDDRWALEDFQQTILSGKKGKRILQGDTCLQLREGVCFVDKISFTHNSENSKNGLYRLGAGVVDAALMNRVEVARTEAFLMKDARIAYYEKHPHPRLSDKVCHLQQICYKGKRHRRLKDEGVITVKDLLTLLYTDQKRLQDILKLGAPSNIWGDIIKNAQACSGMFLCFDPGNEGKTGVVLNAKRQLKGLIVEPYKYVPVAQLSAKEKVDNKDLVKFASQHFETLHSFEDETSLEEYLIQNSFSSLPSPNQSLGTSNIIDRPPTPSSLMSTQTPHNPNNSNSNIGQHTTHTPILTSQYERGKAIVPVDNEMYYPMNYQQEHMPPHSNGHYPTEPGTSSQATEATLNTCGHMNDSNVFNQCIDCLIDGPDFFKKLSHFLNHDSLNSDTIARARTRWTKVAKLLRRNSIRERISHTDGIQSLKKQRCC
ncbi:hypothetical protein L2E82_15840 [Cichorium intybus]|uniref:Uncharacterized protein n=1 Tax=Cichorium intybus TaxID=13427 RepID=A0ACB9F4D5_CICIN|nr:hypothetical protein L2E82_15840 [Cichorium intybus]